MPGLVPGTHAETLLRVARKTRDDDMKASFARLTHTHGVDTRDKRGHDVAEVAG